MMEKDMQNNLDDDTSHPCVSYGDALIGPEPQWIIELKRKAKVSQNLLCFKPITFYLCLTAVGLLLLTTTVTSVWMSWKSHRRNRRWKNRGGSALAEEHFIGTPDSTTASDIIPTKRGIPTISLHSPTSGHMDILADSAFYRPAPSRGDCTLDLPRDSYKQMLINDAYQKMSNGALSTSQRGSKRGQNNLSSWRGAAGSIRRSHNRIQQ